MAHVINVLTNPYGGTMQPDLAQYAATALWSSLDYSTDRPLDDDYGIEDIAPETLAEMRQDLEQFLADNAADIAETGADASQTAHDFWLTRNGHGTGFWDRGYGEAGDRLTEAAHVYGGTDFYVGDDGRIHCNP